MPNTVTLMSEFCPQRFSATKTNTVFCGFPLCVASGSLLAVGMITGPHGRRSRG